MKIIFYQFNKYLILDIRSMINYLQSNHNSIGINLKNNVR